jgi:glycosyltransferase involved in cell wall biosynthesis
LTVPFGDVEGLTRAIERLLDDDDFHRQCSRSGRAYAEVHFDPEAVASAYEKVLLAAMRDPGR